MRVTIIGGTGFLGKAIARHNLGHELLLAGSRDVDIRDRTSVESFIERHPSEWVILAAALADVDRCEREPELANAINHRGAMNVGEACKSQGTRLTFISTDYVFGADTKVTPWEVEDPVSPQNAYARSKVAGEEAVRKILPDACIARVSWLFGAEGRCFPNNLLGQIESGQRTVRAICDQRGVPNFSGEIARCLLLLSQNEASGTVHVTNAGVTSWYEFSHELLALAGYDRISLQPITLAEANRIAKRPHYSALSDRSLRARGLSIPHWRESLPQYLADRAAMALQQP